MSPLKRAVVATMVQEIHDERMNNVNSFIGSLLLFLDMQLFYGNSSMSIKRLRVFPAAQILVPNKVPLVTRFSHSFGLLL